nr:MAG TPA: hypothetical protein [Myoviridae sp. ct5lt7]
MLYTTIEPFEISIVSTVLGISPSTVFAPSSFIHYCIKRQYLTF